MQIFFLTNKAAKRTLERIKKWDPSKTLKENAFESNISHQDAINLASRFNLPHK